MQLSREKGNLTWSMSKNSFREKPQQDEKKQIYFYSKGTFPSTIKFKFVEQ
jgi:hypothetical protein